jgi:hypothetical protein
MEALFFLACLDFVERRCVLLKWVIFDGGVIPDEADRPSIGFIPEYDA